MLGSRSILSFEVILRSKGSKMLKFAQIWCFPGN